VRSGDEMTMVFFRFDPTYIPLWSKLEELSQRLVTYTGPLPDTNLWPVLALGQKGARSLKSCAALISLELWDDAFIIARALFETEITIKWLAEDDTETRVNEYLLGIQREKGRLLSKMGAGSSLTAQAIADTFSQSELRPSINEVTKPSARSNIREMSRDADEERSYDFFNWIASAFAHSHALSIIDCNPDLAHQEKVLSFLFGHEKNGIIRHYLLGGVPTAVLTMFEAVDKKLRLDLARDIEAGWELLRKCLSKTMKMEFSKDMSPGELIYRTVDEDGTVQEKRYSVRKTKTSRSKR
jgi:Family of unknown function (DUF5677)